jgi:rhodanese-related sulfurtransferase
MPGVVIPAEAARLLRQEGAVLVDVREPGEHAALRIPGARNLPLSRLDQMALAVTPGAVVLFHCQTGARTAAHAARLVARVPGCQACLIDGGLDAWQQAGLPVLEETRRPMDLARQGQIALGGLLLASEALGLLVSPWFHLVVPATGAFLVFAGITGQACLTSMLRQLPWNRHIAGVLSARA